MARRTLVADRLANGAYALSERREPAEREPEALASALSRRAVFESVDFRSHEAVVVREDRATTYLVLPFSIPTADSLSSSGGACIALRPEARVSEDYLRGWTHAMKGALGDAIEAGLLDEWAALVYFEERVRSFTDTTEVIVP
ncbi:hypothetical protein HAPAU_01450 [Halalkalicoccus paucihalophilus]|uniref:Uncharacterized protein n=1 Tax=Halalkalicoccus paucihalophilus TaxID=1008153 RepID=A0A151AJ96_9EURY|nr:DUF6735 family protein [Halalkalicoccus paucihalophilus]KYH27477.1 hypothetical protein HAPAU_01450 [Halalkalicoccus paucihalophilus]